MIILYFRLPFFHVLNSFFSLHSTLVLSFHIELVLKFYCGIIIASAIVLATVIVQAANTMLATAASSMAPTVAISGLKHDIALDSIMAAAGNMLATQLDVV